MVLKSNDNQGVIHRGNINNKYSVVLCIEKANGKQLGAVDCTDRDKRDERKETEMRGMREKQG